MKFNTAIDVDDAELDASVDDQFVGSVRNFRIHDIDANAFREAWAGWMATPYFQLNGTSMDGGSIYVDTFSVDDVYNSNIEAVFADGFE